METAFLPPSQSALTSTTNFKRCSLFKRNEDLKLAMRKGGRREREGGRGRGDSFAATKVTAQKLKGEGETRSTAGSSWSECGGGGKGKRRG